MALCTSACSPIATTSRTARSRSVRVQAALPSFSKTSLASIGASALVLASSTLAPASALTSLPPPVDSTPHAPMLGLLADASTGTAAGPADKGPFTFLLKALSRGSPPKVNEDPFGADRPKALAGVGDSQRPIPIPTEQEAVAPEAFPNPSEANGSTRPPVLAAAEADENQGANAGEFSDLTKEGRQALIDKVSPATN